MRYFAFVIMLGLFVGCSSDHSGQDKPAKALIYDKQRFEKGYVRFVDANTTFHVRGKLEITIWDNYVKVEQDTGETYFIPREKVIYMGREIDGRN